MPQGNVTLRCALVLAVVLGAINFSLPSFSHAQTWTDTRRVGPFVCHAEFVLAGLENALVDLGRLQDDVVEQLKIPPAKDPIEVLLFLDERSYRSYLTQHYPKVPYRRALYIKRADSAKVLTYGSDRLRGDLQHEGTHALLHAPLPMIPLWLDEGLAEYFEAPRNGRAAGGTKLKAVRRAAWLGLFTSMEALEAKTEMARMGETEYRDAWAWVHFMLHGSPEAHDELVRYLSDIRDGIPPGKLSQRLSARIGPLKSAFTAYLH